MPSDMDPHILNFYEDLDLPISDVTKIITTVCGGTLRAFEKLDGQNFLFSLTNDRKIRFIGKGGPLASRASNGLSLQEMLEKFSSKEQVRAAFSGAAKALERYFSALPEQIFAGFIGDGSYLMSAEVVSPINMNIVRYSGNTVYLLGRQRMGTKYSIDENFYEFLKNAITFAECIDPINGWNINVPQHVKFKGNVDAQRHVRLHRLKRKIFNDVACEKHNTMQSLLLGLIKPKIYSIFRNTQLNDDLVERIALRLLTRHASINWQELTKLGLWERFSSIEADRSIHLGKWLSPIEFLFRDIGTAVIELYSMKSADVLDKHRRKQIKDFIAIVKSSLRDGLIDANESKLKKIASALSRIRDEDKIYNAEGVVFNWHGKLKKLTGTFTAINRLHGFFAFDDAASFLRR